MLSVSIERTSLSSLLVTDHLIFWGRGVGWGRDFFPQPEGQNFFFFRQSCNKIFYSNEYVFNVSLTARSYEDGDLGLKSPVRVSGCSI